MSCVVSSRTWGGGEPRRCPICAALSWVEPSVTVVDAPCLACGHLLWPAHQTRHVITPGFRLRRRCFSAGTDREENCASPPGGGRRDKAVREQAEVSPTGALAGGSLGRLARHLSTPLFRFHIPHPRRLGTHSAAGAWSGKVPGTASRTGRKSDT